MADKRKNRGASSSDEEDKTEDAEKGTLRTGIIALQKIKDSSFDQRDTSKLEFLNLYHTFKNFKIYAKKTQQDGLTDYLRLMVDIVTYIQGAQFAQFFANFDRKLRKNVVKRCLV